MKRRHRGSPTSDDIRIRELIVGHRKALKSAAAFTCICCRQDKASSDAEGVHVYKTDDPVLQRAMQTPEGPRVGTYVICIACVNSLPDDVIYEKVTATFAEAGFFGRIKAISSNTEGRRQPEVPDIRNPEIQSIQQDLTQLKRNILEERRSTDRCIVEERELARWELERLRAEVTAQVSYAERANTVLIAALVRLQDENERLREEIYRRDSRRLNMAQPHRTSSGSRKNPKVSLSVKYEAVGHDKAAYERLLELLRELAQSKGSSQIEQKCK